VLLVKWLEGQWQRWADAEEAWAYSTLRVDARQINQTREPVAEDELKAFKRLQETLPNQGKWHIVLPLKKNENGIWAGEAYAAKKDEKTELRAWHYDEKLGLREKS